MNLRLLVAAASLGLAAIVPPGANAKEPAVQASSRSPQLPVEGRLPSFEGAVEWLNSAPLTPAMLRGKVVLVEFWTYTCINWQRTEPYVRAWAEKYKDRGLVVIGVHTPEFEFEKIPENIRMGVQAFRVGYPVAVDSGYAVWRAFRNRYWPAIYIADANGDLRYHQFGEGEYERTEAVIRQLLRESGQPEADDRAAQPDPRGSEVAADWTNLRSSETYLGRDQATGFVSRAPTVIGTHHRYTAPASPRLNQWGLAGDWNVRGDAVALEQPGGRILYRFHARDVNLVMGPATRGAAVRFRVLIDGRPPGSDHGGDVDEAGNGTVTGQRLYQLIRQADPTADRLFEIEFLDPGVEAFVFTFG
jgi:thiol-disulfide isomerase/thioredoxin